MLNSKYNSDMKICFENKIKIKLQLHKINKFQRFAAANLVPIVSNIVLSTYKFIKKVDVMISVLTVKIKNRVGNYRSKLTKINDRVRQEQVGKGRGKYSNVIWI